MTDLLQKLEAQIQSLQLGNHPANLYDPMRYMLSLGGKRLRPLLVLLGYRLHKQDVAEVLIPALSVELFHNFTLMHDDIMDKAPLRRGNPTVHEKWNETVAILSGDTMMVKAYDLMLKMPPEYLAAAITKFNKCSVEVCEGQQLDMNYEELATVTEQQYLEMIRLKTAVLLGYSLELGGLMAGLSETKLKQLQMLGEKAGIGFQLMDDLLDVYADKAKFGKQVGGDIVSNKKTYLLIKARELSNGAQKEKLCELLEAESFDAEEKVASVKQIYQEIGIAEITARKMNEYYDEAFRILSGFEGDRKGKEELRSFLEKLMQRDR
ncbi:MAG: polyprenyl synthetase family protein [Bacteroidota bacterium]